MGQNQIIQNTEKNNNNENKTYISVNDQLTEIIKKEIKTGKKKFPKKSTKHFKFSKKNVIISQLDKTINDIYNDSDNEDEEEPDEITLKGISDLMDRIYTKNTNLQLDNRVNKSVYETVFDLRNMMDFTEDLSKNEYNNSYNAQACQIMRNIIEPEIFEKNKNDNAEKAKNEQDNNEEDNNIDNYYIEKDFFKKWDYKDDIFINEFDENLKEIEEKESQEIENKENKINESNNTIKENEEDNKKNINKINKSNSKIKNYDNNNINEYEKKKDNKKVDVDDSINNKDNNTINEYFEIIENKEKEENKMFKDNNKNKNKNVNNDSRLLQEQRITSTNPNASKYYKDSDDSEQYDIGNETKKNILNITSSDSDENNEVTSIIHNFDPNNSNEKDKKKMINTKFEYNNKSNVRELYKKKRIKDSRKSNINKKDNDIQIIQNNENNNQINKNNKNKNNESFSIDDYYRESFERSRSPIVSRIRNRRVDYRKVMIEKGINTDAIIPTSQVETRQIGFTVKPKKYISKTPEKILIKPKAHLQNKTTIINNNINDINILHTAKTNDLSHNYKKQKFNYDISDINSTIKRIEEQIKSIEKYEKQNKHLNNKNNNKFFVNINNIKSINNVGNSNFNTKENQSIQTSNYRKKNNRRSRVTKTFDDKSSRDYQIIMPKINEDREKRKNDMIQYGGTYYRNQTPNIQIKKNKVKKKKIKDMDSVNIKRINRFNIDGKTKKKENNTGNNLRTAIRIKTPWK